MVCRKFRSFWLLSRRSQFKLSARWADFFMAKTGDTYTGRETLIFCFILLATLVVIAFFLETGADRLVTLALMCCSSAVGYSLGVFITPYNAKEKSEFYQIGKFVSALITGFVLAKLEPVVSKILSSDQMVTPAGLFRLASVSTSFLVSLIGVFVYRKYVFAFDEDSK